MTIVVKEMDVDRETARRSNFVKSENGRITDIMVHPQDFSGRADMILNILVMSRKALYDMVCDAQVHNYKSISLDIIARNKKIKNYRIYRSEGHFACLSSMEHYFSENMALILDKNVYSELFCVKNRPIHTKVRNSAPTFYEKGSSAKNCLVADGCVIEGEIENCILFRGVRIGKGAKVKNSILFQDVCVSDDADLDYVIADKNVMIRENRRLYGCAELPYYIDKGKMI